MASNDLLLPQAEAESEANAAEHSLLCPCRASTYEPRRQLKGDILAGITVGVMIVPQSMAYAELAGLPVAMGLYSSGIPLLVYAALGSSKHVGCGPQALMSLMIRSATFQLGQAGLTSSPQDGASLLSLLVGLMSCAMGLLGMGSLQSLVSRSVLSAFVTATSVIIIFEELGDLLGLADVPEQDYPWQTLWYVIQHISETKRATAALGILSIAVAVIAKRCKPSRNTALGFKKQAILFVCDFSVLIIFMMGSVWAWFCDRAFHVEVKTVGNVPAGMTALKMPSLPPISKLVSVTPLVFSISLISHIMGVGAGAPFAIKFGYRIRGNQELMAFGTANAVGSLFGAFPVSGSASRSSVNASSGATSTLSIAVTGVVALAALEFLAPVFTWLPLTSLAAIIIASVFDLMAWRGMLDAYRVSQGDFLVMLVTLGVSVGLGLEPGLFFGIIMSIAALTRHAANPNMVVLGETDTGALLTQSHCAPGQTKPIPGAVCFRLDAPLCFANAELFQDFISREVMKQQTALGFHDRKPVPIRFVLVDMRGVNIIDLSGLQVLAELQYTLKQENIDILLGNLKYTVIKALVAAQSRTHLIVPPEEHLFLDIREAQDFAKGISSGERSPTQFARYKAQNWASLGTPERVRAE